MTDKIKLIVTLGFGVAAVFMLGLVIVAMTHLRTANDTMTALVDRTSVKMRAAYIMRDAVTGQAADLQRLQDSQAAVPDLRDRLQRHAANYRNASERLIGRGLNRSEQALYSQQALDARLFFAEAGKAIDLFQSTPSAATLNSQLRATGAAYDNLLLLLDELVALESQLTRQALQNSRTNYSQSRWMLLAILAFGILFCALIAWYVIERSNSRHRQKAFQDSHDPLTGLMNRKTFEQHVRAAIESARHEGREHTLLYIDLDQFKLINDSCGHLVGDEMLCQLTRVLRDRMRSRDILARLGGDEFGVLLEHCPLRWALRIGESLRRCVQDFHFRWDNEDYQTAASIGVVPILRDSPDLNSVLAAADAACYQAKDNGRNRVQVYETPATPQQVQHSDIIWVNQINRALKHGRFELYYQSIVPVASKQKTKTIEILVRMLDDSGQPIQPVSFLPAAEHYSLAAAVDRWVIEHTVNWVNCVQGLPEGLRISINLSGQSVVDDSILDFIIEQIARARIPGSQFCFEITEAIAIGNLSRTIDFCKALQAEDCLIALDSFGTGLSPFAYLKLLPVDFLKIDGSLIRNIADNPIDLTMVRAINDIGHIMARRTIAKSVEHNDVMERLQEMGIDYAQGFAIATPRPLSRFEAQRLSLVKNIG